MGLTKPRAAQIYNLDYKQATRVVATVNITLSGGTPATVDGVSLSINDRVLVTAQTTRSQNGLYLVTTVGSGSNGTWVRTTDADNTGEIDAGMIVMVTEGAIYADTQWKLITDNPITVGSTALTFTQNYSANSISGGTSNVTVYSNANVTISSAGTPNVLTVSSTGTVTSGTASVSGNVTGGNILTGGVVSSTGNVTGGNILTGGAVSATGNITGNYFLGNVFYANGITASKIYNGTSEANVGSSGGNANISIGGTSNVAVFATTGLYINGVSSVSGNVTGGNILTGGATSSTGNITGGNVLTSGLVSATGNINGANIIASKIISATDNLVITSSGGEGGQLVLGWVGISGIQGQSNSTWNIDVDSSNVLRVFSQNAASQANVALTVNPATGNVNISGNVTPAAIYTNGYYYANGAVFGGGGGGGTPGGANTYVQFNDNGVFNGTAGFTFNKTTNALSATGTISVTGNITGGNLIAGGVISTTGASTAGSYSTGGNVTGGNINTAGILSVNTNNAATAIVNAGTNGAGNIGSSGAAFNTVFAKATTAQYADLAEMYLADTAYVSGTVVEFGGSHEITVTTTTHSTQVAGIISTNPAYLMNSTQAGEHSLEVALVGRVPCLVVGTIRKGDRLVSSNTPGVAQALNANLYQPGCIIGKALEEYNSTEPGVIEVAVGRF